MAKQRDPLRDEAKRLFDESGGNITNREIAARLGTDEKKVAVWKQRDGWTIVQQKKTVQQTTEVQQKKAAKKADKKLVKAAAENTELTEQQKIFCLLYVKTFNATQSYMIAYESSQRTAHSYGYTQLQRPEIRAEIQRLQEIRNQAILAGTQDIVMLHMRIAFADITDIVDFHGGFVILRDSSEVDGQLIDSVKETNNGISIKLADRQKSLAFLERYFLMNPMDKHKQAFDDAKLELERRKAQMEDDRMSKVVQIIDDI